MDMVSMKRTAADKRADKMEQAPIEAIAPDYPYGLCIHLDKDELDKLGMGKSLPKVGAEYTWTVKATVTAARQSVSTSTRGDDEYTSVDFQITDIGTEEAE